MSDCKKCPFYKTEPVPEDLAGKVNLTEWSSCDVDAVGLAAADRIANQSTHIAALQKEIENLRWDLNLHRCATCDFWRENDPRCMNGQSQWGGKSVPKDNYCRYWEHHTDWIPVTERLPENEQDVLIQFVRKYGEKVYPVVGMAFHTDGQTTTEDSDYVWQTDYIDMPYDEEKDAYIIPEGWWETVHFGEEFAAVDMPVTHWMPLPEPPEVEL